MTPAEIARLAEIVPPPPGTLFVCEHEARTFVVMLIGTRKGRFRGVYLDTGEPLWWGLPDAWHPNPTSGAWQWAMLQWLHKRGNLSMHDGIDGATFWHLALTPIHEHGPETFAKLVLAVAEREGKERQP